MGGRDKIGFDADRLRALGLFLHPRAGWRCGDYAYYVTRAARPDYDFYWLTEPDVLINTGDLAATFAALNAGTADLLAPRLYERDARWEWSRTMRGRYETVYGCIFPITRLSGRAIDHLHAARRAALVEESRAAFSSWPNDEVFVATEAMNNSFACKDILEQLPGSYTRDSLRTGLPHDRARLETGVPNGLIYHPVRDFRAWFEEKSEWLTEYGRNQRTAASPDRDKMRQLLGMGAGGLENEEFRDAALLPLMLARGRPMESPPFADYPQLLRRVTKMLDMAFGTGRNRTAFATAYLLGEPAVNLPKDTTEADDFPLAAPVPLVAMPMRDALPYAFDFDDETLLFTLHSDAPAVVAAASMLAAQRETAAVGCKVAWRHLARFIPEPDVPAEVTVTTDIAAAERMRALGYFVMAMPAALQQVLAGQERFLSLRPAVRRLLLRSALAPAGRYQRVAVMVNREASPEFYGALPWIRIEGQV